MSVNWASFGASESEGGASGNPNDDDWAMDDDFGGFEAAEPVPPEIADQVQASPSPWAVFPPVVATPGQPDLLQAQSQPQQAKSDLGLDATFPGDAIPSSTQPEITSQIQPNPLEIPPSLPQPELTASVSGTLTVEPEITTSSIVRNTPPPELTTTQAEAAVQNAKSNKLRLDDFGLSDDDDDLPTFNIGTIGGAARKPDGITQTPQPKQRLATVNHVTDTAKDSRQSKTVNEESQNNEKSKTVEKTVGKDNEVLNEQLKEMEGKLSAADRERLRLQKELEDLLEKSKLLESQVKEHTLEADEQKRKYEEMQDKQSKEIEEIRKAGHDALAIIIEEYKELSKLAVQQQQETSEKQLQTAIQTETETSKTMLRAQHERLMKVVEEEKELGENRLKEALEEQQTLSQKLIEKCVEEEREKANQAIQQAVEEANQAHQLQLEKVLQEERQQTRKLLEEERNRSSKLLEEERETSRKTVEKALNEERQRSKEAIKTVFEEERDKQETAIKQVTLKCREEMLQYIQEQRKADSTLRQRSLASMDLFLESARQQLQLLMQDNLGAVRDTNNETP
ncbi:coiled-coil domain-containing protein 91-like isoform X2 [Glandiceps talaboti]